MSENNIADLEIEDQKGSFKEFQDLNCNQRPKIPILSPGSFPATLPVIFPTLGKWQQ